MLFNPLCYLSIFIEKRSRIAEISMYVVPKYIESIPVFLEKMKIKPNIPFAVHLMLAFSMGAIASVINTEPQALKYQYWKLLELIMGGSDKEELEKRVKEQEKKVEEQEEVEGSLKVVRRLSYKKKVRFQDSENKKAETQSTTCKDEKKVCE